MYEYKVKEVVKVVDGDTVDILIDLGFGLTKKERVRVAGIDTPESRTRDLKEKRYGLEAKDYIQGLLSSGSLSVRTEKDGKYGRMLGWLYVDKNEKSVNEIMIEAGYAFPYDGGTKLTGEERFTYLDEQRANYLNK